MKKTKKYKIVIEKYASDLDKPYMSLADARYVKRSIRYSFKKRGLFAPTMKIRKR
jgi:hypothetical protein